MLENLGIQPEVFHLNEGHAAFIGLERLRKYVQEGLSISQAVEVIRSSSLFTTHTPVPAGHDIFYRDRRLFSGAKFARDTVIASLAFAYSAWAIWGAGQEVVAKGFMLLLAGIPVYVWLKWRQSTTPPSVREVPLQRPGLPLKPPAGRTPAGRPRSGRRDSARRRPVPWPTAVRTPRATARRSWAWRAEAGFRSRRPSSTPHPRSALRSRGSRDAAGSPTAPESGMGARPYCG